MTTLAIFRTVFIPIVIVFIQTLTITARITVIASVSIMIVTIVVLIILYYQHCHSHGNVVPAAMLMKFGGNLYRIPDGPDELIRCYEPKWGCSWV